VRATKRPSKKELRDALLAINHAGAMMANLCHNLKQSTVLPEGHRRSCEEAHKTWDRVTEKFNLCLRDAFGKWK
jgi:hypothetical protein